MNNSKLDSHAKTFQAILHGCVTTFTLLQTNKFRISCIDEEAQSVYHVEFDKEFLTNADPTILSTFESIQSMYDELVEIAKTEPSDFIIQPSGKIRVLITLAMKSGSKKKQLVFETEKRSMQLAETLQLQLRRNEKINSQQQKQLRQQIETLKKKLHQTQKQNSQLSAMLTQIRSEVKSDVLQLKTKVESQKNDLSAILNDLRANVQDIKRSLIEVQDDIATLMKGFKKISMKADQNCHSIKNSNKDKTFKVEDFVIEKIGGSWAQVLSQDPLRSPKSFFDIKIVKTRKSYICIGIGGQTCKDQDDSKWEKPAVTLFLLDNSIICQGKSAEDLGMKDKLNEYKAKEGDIVRVHIDLSERKINWKVKQKVLGTGVLSQEFESMGKNSKLYPLVICQDEGDKIS